MSLKIKTRRKFTFTCRLWFFFLIYFFEKRYILQFFFKIYQVWLVMTNSFYNFLFYLIIFIRVGVCNCGSILFINFHLLPYLMLIESVYSLTERQRLVIHFRWLVSWCDSSIEHLWGVVGGQPYSFKICKLSLTIPITYFTDIILYEYSFLSLFV